MGLFVQDGYTFADSVPAMPPVYGEVSYHYRPALSEQRNEWLMAGTAKARDTLSAKFIAKYLVDLAENGQPVTVTEALIPKLYPAIQQHILDRILGYAGPAEIADAKN